MYLSVRLAIAPTIVGPLSGTDDISTRSKGMRGCPKPEDKVKKDELQEQKQVQDVKAYVCLTGTRLKQRLCCKKTLRSEAL